MLQEKSDVYFEIIKGVEEVSIIFQNSNGEYKMNSFKNSISSDGN